MTKLVDIEVMIDYRTPKAVLVTPTGLTTAVWVPLSLCQLDPFDAVQGDMAILTTTAWTAKDKGLV